MKKMSLDLFNTDGSRTARGIDERSALVARRWVAAVLGCAVAVGLFAMTYWIFVQTGTGQLADESAFKGAQQYLGDGTRFGAPLSKFLGYLPEVAAVLGVIALVLAGLIRRSVVAPAIAAATWALATYSTQVLKHSVLTRPDNGVSEATMNSFPSGHTTFGTAAMIAILLVVAPRWRPLVAFLGGLVSLVTGVSTVALGWHRPSDILGAYIVCAFWGFLGGAAVLATGHTWNMRPLEEGAGRRFLSNFHVGSWALWPTLLWLPSIIMALAAPVIYWFATQTSVSSQLLTKNSWLFLAGIFLMSATALFTFGVLNLFLAHLRARESFFNDYQEQPIWTSPVVASTVADGMVERPGTETQAPSRAAPSYEI